jgi:hypothetical protein
MEDCFMKTRNAQVDLYKQHLDAGLDPDDLIYLQDNPQPAKRTQVTYVRGICIG